MAYEFRELTDTEYKQYVDYKQRIMYLESLKDGIEAEKETAEVGWKERDENLNAEIAKNNDVIINIRSVAISGKTFIYSAITDANAKELSDLDQRIKALMLEKARIQTERAKAQIAWRVRASDIDKEIHTFKDAITFMREAKEVI